MEEGSILATDYSFVSELSIVRAAELLARERNVQFGAALSELAGAIDRNSLPDTRPGMASTKGKLRVYFRWGYLGEASYFAIEELTDGMRATDHRLEAVAGARVKKEHFRDWCIENSKPLPRFWFSAHERVDETHDQAQRERSNRNSVNQNIDRSDDLERLAKRAYRGLIAKHKKCPTNDTVIGALVAYDSDRMTIDSISDGIIHWTDQRGRMRKTTYKSFYNRMTQIRKLETL